MSKYQGVCLPTILLDRIEEIKETFGYTSRADFVKQACRRELERISKMRGVAK